MAAAFQLIQFAPGEALTLSFTMTQKDGVTPQNGSIATYTLTFTARLADGSIAFACSLGSGVAITDNGGISLPGKYTVSPTAAQTALFPSPSKGTWDVWRTNSGTEAQLAVGTLEADPQYRTGT